VKSQGEKAAKVYFGGGEDPESECAGYVNYDAGGALKFEK
jgi:hypothetical protein